VSTKPQKRNYTTGVIEGFWRSFKGFHISSLESIPYSLILVSLHSKNFYKMKLLSDIFKLFTLKVRFWVDYMEEHLSVIARWK